MSGSVLLTAHTYLWLGQQSSLLRLLDSTDADEFGGEHFKNQLYAEAYLMQALLHVRTADVGLACWHVDKALAYARACLRKKRKATCRYMTQRIRAESSMDGRRAKAFDHSKHDQVSLLDCSLLVLECECLMLRGVLSLLLENPLKAAWAMRSCVRKMNKLGANALMGIVPNYENLLNGLAKGKYLLGASHFDDSNYVAKKPTSELPWFVNPAHKQAAENCVDHSDEEDEENKEDCYLEDEPLQLSEDEVHCLRRQESLEAVGENLKDFHQWSHFVHRLKCTLGVMHVCVSMAPSVIVSLAVNIHGDLAGGVELLYSVVCDDLVKSPLALCVLLCYLMFETSTVTMAKHIKMIKELVNQIMPRMSSCPLFLTLVSRLAFQEKQFEESNTSAQEALRLYRDAYTPAPSAVLYHCGLLFFIRMDAAAALEMLQQMMSEMQSDEDSMVRRHMYVYAGIYAAACAAFLGDPPKVMDLMSVVTKCRPSPYNKKMHRRTEVLFSRACVQGDENSAMLFGVELLYLHNSWAPCSFDTTTHSRCLTFLSGPCFQGSSDLAFLLKEREYDDVRALICNCVCSLEQLDTAVHWMLLKGIVLSRITTCTNQCFEILTAVGKIAEQITLPCTNPLVSYALYVGSVVLFTRQPNQDTARAAAGALSKALAFLPSSNEYKCSNRISHLQKEIQLKFPFVVGAASAS